ncbi:MAG TPA: DUF1549 domain-containing protein, partial [Pirellulales bacterium]|nr:DUF1549 domain-containing protein [Pirellulales bacterium]
MNIRLLMCVCAVAGWDTIAVAARPTSLATPSVVATVNDQLRAAWQEHHLTAAPDVDDAGWLRRVTLDITGTLPESQEVRNFLDDTADDKRARAVERLLSSAAYAEHWATYWDNVLMGRLTREIYLDRPAFHEWLVEQFASNTPWDKIVRELVTAEGYNSTRQPLRGGGEMPSDLATRFNPAVNWFLRYSRSLPDLSSATSKVFLGVQIQCAQCHDHKTEKWTQNDFKQFTACFSKTFPTYVDKGRMLGQMVGINRLELKDRWFAPPVDKYEQLFGSYKDYIDPKPKLLDGPE